jgi:hypothetical protein
VSRPRAVPVALAALALHALLLAHGAPWLPGPLRLALALAVLVLAPGWAFVALGARPPGGAWLAAGWAFGLGIAWNAAGIALVAALGQSFLAFGRWAPLAGLLPWVLVVARGRAGVRSAPDVLPRAAALAVLLAALLVTVHAARLGPVMGFSGDAPDHVGTLRRMLQTGELFPEDTFFRDAGRLGADPRKGLWHGIVALLARLADLDPVECWRWLSALVTPLFVLNVAALGFLCRGPTGAALAAWLLPLVYGGGLAQSPLRHAGYASLLDEQLAVAAAVAVLADLRRRATATRLAAVALGFAAVAVHVFAALHLAVVLTALGLGLLLRDRGAGAEARRLAGTALLMAAANAPYLVLRLLTAHGPGNVIHTEPQGLTFLTDRFYVVSIGQLWAWGGPAWVLVPLAWPWLWTRGRRDTPVLFLLTSSVAVALIAYDPFLVPLLRPALGYLLMRLLVLVPVAVVIAWLLAECAATLRTATPWRRAVAGVLGLGALVLLAAPARDAVQVLADPGLVTARERAESPERWRGELAWLARNLGEHSVVLADPATSYLVPMMTGRRVVTAADQHGPPNDLLALTRLLGARDALDPYGTWERTREVVRASGADVVALNGRFAEPPRLQYWAPGPAWFAAARARFDAQPQAFPRLLDAGDFVVYGIRRAALDTLSAAPRPRPFVEPWRPGAVDPRTLAGAAAAAAGMPVPLWLTLAADTLAPGGSVDGRIRWHAVTPAPAGAYTVVVRCDRESPPGPAAPAWIGKPVRKLAEARRHERYRFSHRYVPVGGVYGVDRWRPDEVVRDSFRFEVPADAAAGTYRVEVRMLREPRYVNLRLSDWFFDRDGNSGRTAGRLVVARGPRVMGEEVPIVPR